MAAGSTRPPAAAADPRPRAPKAASRTRADRAGVRLLTGVGGAAARACSAARAAFLGTVRADDLSSRGREAHRFEVDLLAPRGSLVARRRHRPGHRPPGGGRHRLARPRHRRPGRRRPARADHRPRPQRAGERPRRAGPLRRARARRRPAAPPTGRGPSASPGIYFSDTYQRFVPGGPHGGAGDRPDRRRAARASRAWRSRLDRPLTGTPGRRLEVRDVFGRPIQALADREADARARTSSSRSTRPSRPRWRRVLAETREKYGAKSAMAIVMDPRDGSILAMASVPRFNPNKRAELNPELERNRPVVGHVRAGLDLQDRDDDRRPRGRQGHAHRRASTCPTTSRSTTAR